MGWNLALARLAKQMLFDAGLFFLLAFFILVFCKGNALKLARPFLLLYLGLFTFFCSPWAPALLSRGLLAQTEALRVAADSSQCLETFETVVVLGGGIVSAETPSLETLSRIQTAAKYLRQSARFHQLKTVVLSGGATLEGAGVSEADVMGQTLQLYAAGADSIQRILLEKQSLNTHENAVFTKNLLQNENRLLRVIVVTSELHIPRAIASFRAQGFRTCALPAPSFEGVSAGFLAFRHGANTVSVLNEHLGTLGYWLRGWIGGG